MNCSKIILLVLLINIAVCMTSNEKRSLMSKHGRKLQSTETQTNILGHGWISYVFAAIFILVGVPMAFFGLKFWGWFSFVFGAMGGAVIGMTIKLAIENAHDIDGFWPNFGLWSMVVVIAVACGLLALLLRKCAYVIPGGWGGWIVGSIVAGVIASFLDGGVMAWYWWLTCQIGFAILGVVIAFLLSEVFIVFITALYGSQLAFTGLGKMTGQYPAAPGQAAWIFWLYFGFLLAMIAAGIVVQCIYYHKHHQKGTHYSKNKRVVTHTQEVTISV